MGDAVDMIRMLTDPHDVCCQCEADMLLLAKRKARAALRQNTAHETPPKACWKEGYFEARKSVGHGFRKSQPFSQLFLSNISL